MTPPTPNGRVCPDCGSDEISRHSFEECCAILKQQRDAMKAERDAAVQKAHYESDVAAQAMAAKDTAERERGDADDALAACQAQAAGTIAQLREKLAALTAHMNQVHETLGGSDTVLTLEAALYVVAKLDAAVRELSQEKEGSTEWEEESAAWSRKCLDVQEECDELRVKLADAERERDDAKVNEALSNEQRAVLFCENAKLLAKLAEAEKLNYWFLKKYPATWARAKRTLFADTARTVATAQGDTV
jgi:hypothetical protein